MNSGLQNWVALPTGAQQLRALKGVATFKGPIRSFETQCDFRKWQTPGQRAPVLSARLWSSIMTFDNRTKKWIIAAGAVLVVLILAFAVKQARAADVPSSSTVRATLVKAPEPWTKFYFGGHFGYGMLDTSGSIGPLGGPAGPSFSYGGDRDGFFYGAHAGAQKQFDWLVLGLEGSLAKANINGTSAVNGPAGPIAGVSTSYDVSWLAMAEVKAGIAMGAWLPHLTAGGACGLGNATISFAGPPATAFGSSDTWSCGWTLGAGLELALADNLSVFARANYVNLGTSQVSTPVGAVAPGVGISAPLDVKGWLFKGGANLLF